MVFKGRTALPSDLVSGLTTMIAFGMTGYGTVRDAPAALARTARRAASIFSRRARDAQVLLDGVYNRQEDHGETLLVVNRFAGKGLAEGLAREMRGALAGAAESYFTTAVSAQRIWEIREALLQRRASSNGEGVNIVATGGDSTVDETMVATVKTAEALEWDGKFRVTPHPAGVANDFALMAGAFDNPQIIGNFLSLAEEIPLFGMHVRYGGGKPSALTFHSATWGASGEMFHAIKKIREVRTESGGPRITVDDYLRMMPGVIAAAKPFFVSVNGGKAIKVADVVAVSDMHSLGSVLHVPLPPMYKGGLRLFLIPPAPFCLPMIVESFFRGALLKAGFQAVALTERLLTIPEVRQIDVPVGESVELEFFGANGRHRSLRGTVSGEFFSETDRVKLTPKAEPVTILAGPRSDLMARKRMIDASWPLGVWFNTYLAPFLNKPRLLVAPPLFGLALAFDLATHVVEN